MVDEASHHTSSRTVASQSAVKLDTVVVLCVVDASGLHSPTNFRWCAANRPMLRNIIGPTLL